mmetsp:Transcript_58175/g.177279  ORF Transcript_58175/g.177279 Transcript_58175/m.177279 type:complete len:204 (-) Transcript_58175:1185-1796(-)
MLRRVARAEKLVRGVHKSFRHRVVVQAAHGVLSKEKVGLEERVRLEGGLENLHVQITHHVRRQDLQERDLFLTDAVVDLRRVLDARPDARHEIHRHLVLAQPLPQLSLPVHALGLQVLQVHHGAADAADERREGQQTEKDDANVEHPLHEVVRADLHGGGHELRKRPMQGGGVAVEDVRGAIRLLPAVAQDVLRHPRGAVRGL